MKCPSCNGTGDMPFDQVHDCYERDGHWPNRRFGCLECDGLGEVEVDVTD
jgi:hypothetical protein